MKIVFMGSPDFAIPSLDLLIQQGFDLVGVVTATDKYGGRSKSKLIESDVKKYAREQGLRILQPPNLKSDSFIQELQELNADLFVVVAFRMLPEAVWSLPPLGTINLHGSLLPAYRGAAPINWAIAKGEEVTGLTTFIIDRKIDTGAILLQKQVPIGHAETAGELYHRMKVLGAELVLETVRLIESGDYIPLPQDDTKASKAPKLYHENCELSYTWTTKQAYDFVRGMSPYPAAWISTSSEEKLKIFRCQYTLTSHEKEPGHIEIDPRAHFRIYFSDGYLELVEVQAAGKRKMKIKDYLNGLRL